jgi:hypothetical protein
MVKEASGMTLRICGGMIGCAHENGNRFFIDDFRRLGWGLDKLLQ